MSTKIIRLPEVLKKIGLCRASLYEFMAKRNFPKQIKLGARSVGWLESEVDFWIETQIEKSRNVIPDNKAAK